MEVEYTNRPLFHSFLLSLVPPPFSSLFHFLNLQTKPRDTRAPSLSAETLSQRGSWFSSRSFQSWSRDNWRSDNRPLRTSVGIHLTVPVEQKSCSGRVSWGSGDPTVRRITLNIWVCLNVCVNTPSGLMCSVEFWLHLGSIERHRQHCLRSNRHTHAHTRTQKHTPTFLYLCIFSSFLSVRLSLFFVSRSFSHAVASGWHTTTDGLNWNTHTYTLKHTYTRAHTHTHAHTESSRPISCLPAAASVKLRAESLFQSVGPSTSFGAVWKNLALIFNKVRKTIFFRAQWLHKVSWQSKKGSNNKRNWTSFPLLNIDSPLQAHKTLLQIPVEIPKCPNMSHMSVSIWWKHK